MIVVTIVSTLINFGAKVELKKTVAHPKTPGKLDGKEGTEEGRSRRIF